MITAHDIMTKSLDYYRDEKEVPFVFSYDLQENAIGFYFDGYRDVNIIKILMGKFIFKNKQYFGKLEHWSSKRVMVRLKDENPELIKKLSKGMIDYFKSVGFVILRTNGTIA